MKIEILGTGCTKCHKLYDAALAAVAQTGANAEVSKVEDLAEIMKRGVMITPALAVDGQIKSSGKVLKVEEIVKMLG